MCIRLFDSKEIVLAKLNNINLNRTSAEFIADHCDDLFHSSLENIMELSIKLDMAQVNHNLII